MSFPPLTAYRVHRSDGTSYVTSMAAGVTLADARAYFVGSIQYDETETKAVTVTDVTPDDDDADEKARVLKVISEVMPGWKFSY